MNANYIHNFNRTPNRSYLVSNDSKPAKAYESKPWTAEEIADFRAWLRSGLTENEYDRRKAEGTL